jgi:hypothetical protein
VKTGFQAFARGHVAQKPRLFGHKGGTGCEVRVKFDAEYTDRETDELKSTVRYVGFTTFDSITAAAVEAQLGTGDFVELTASEDYADVWVTAKGELKRKSVVHVLATVKVLRKAGQPATVPAAEGEPVDAERERESRQLAGVS